MPKFKPHVTQRDLNYFLRCSGFFLVTELFDLFCPQTQNYGYDKENSHPKPSSSIWKENFEKSCFGDRTCFHPLFKSYPFAGQMMGISNVSQGENSPNFSITLQGYISYPPLETALGFCHGTPIHLSYR